MSTVRTKKTTGLVISALTAGSLVLTACGGSDSNAGGASPSPSAAPATSAATEPSAPATSEAPAPASTAPAPNAAPVTITVDSFGGIFDSFKKAGLLDAYKKTHPNVTVKVVSEVQMEDQYWTALQTKLSSNTGLADIQPIEVGRVGLVSQTLGDKFLDFNTTAAKDHVNNDYSAAKKGAMTTPDGAIVGMGTDAGPMALCFRNDKLKAAGLPSTPDALSAEIKNFDDYISVGKQYTDKTKKAWMDTAGGYYRLLGSVEPQLYADDNGESITDGDTLKKIFDASAEAAKAGLTLKVDQFSNEWNTAMSTGDFATIACPAWMLGYIKGQAGDKNAKNWSVMPLPGGVGGNWGGSYLSIPKTSKNAEAATELATFLTSAESEATEFKAGLAFPSNLKSLAMIADTKDAYFNNAPIGKIFTDSTNAVKNQPVGQFDGAINTAYGDALNSVVRNGVSVDKAFQAATSAAADAAGK